MLMKFVNELDEVLRNSDAHLNCRNHSDTHWVGEFVCGSKRFLIEFEKIVVFAPLKRVNRTVSLVNFICCDFEVVIENDLFVIANMLLCH